MKDPKGYTSAQLDAWITGNYGYDHPDNQPCYCPHCDAELTDDDISADKCSNCGKEVESENKLLKREEREEDWW